MTFAIGSPKLRRLHHDHETFCRFSLPDVGTSRYARDPSCEVLMTAFAFDDEPVEQWVPVECEKMPAKLEDGLLDERITKFAWNKPFEYNINRHVLGIDVPHRHWRDPMILAFALSLPGSLEAAGRVVGLDSDKAKVSRGKALIREFCGYRKPTKLKPQLRSEWFHEPQKWEEFKHYNRQDVEAERAIWKRLRKYDLPAHEWELWAVDQEINEAGIPINMAVVRNALDVYGKVLTTRLDELKEITELANPNSAAQLLPWLKAEGYPFDDLKKGHVTRALESAEERCAEDPACIPEERHYRRALELRQEVSRTAPKKYKALADAVDVEPGERFGLLRYAFQFAGAGRTWRWSGRRYQPQNLAKPAPWLEDTQAEAVRDLEFLTYEQIESLYPKPMDLLATCVRPVVQAPPTISGEEQIFVDADLNAIENRVLGWMAKDQKILDVFKHKRDPYIDFATYLYHVAYDVLFAQYKDGDKSKRTVAKPGVLGCGYRLSAGQIFENEQTGEIEATGLLGYAWNMGVKLTMEQAEQSVKVWRETFADAVQFWYDIEKAAMRCVRLGLPTEIGPIRFTREGPWLRMWLPSGRTLWYCRPRIEEKKMPWGKMKAVLTYEGQNDKNQWTRIQTHGGKLTENADQAISRDLLAHGMTLARNVGIDLRLHVHDQLVGLVLKRQSNWAMVALQECMETNPPWALDLPLGSAGAVSPIFLKD